MIVEMSNTYQTRPIMNVVTPSILTSVFQTDLHKMDPSLHDPKKTVQLFCQPIIIGLELIQKRELGSREIMDNNGRMKLIDGRRQGVSMRSTIPRKKPTAPLSGNRIKA
jgi:hypothetical protein